MQLASEYADARSEQKRAALQTAADREFKQQCPFTPRVSRVSRQIVANMRAAALTAAAHATATAAGGGSGADADAAFAFGIGDAAAGMNAAQVWGKNSIRKPHHSSPPKLQLVRVDNLARTNMGQQL